VSEKGVSRSFQLGGNLYLIFVLVTHVQQSVSGPEWWNCFPF